MPRSDKKKATDAVEIGGVQEDGDFVALRESRERREPEILTLEDVLPCGDTFEILNRALSNRDVAMSPPSFNYPESPRPKLSLLGRIRRTGKSDPWENLADAALYTDFDRFKRILDDVGKKYGLVSPRLQDRKTGKNILHFALDYADDQVIDHIVAIADSELILQEFEVTVSKITGKKNAFHQLVERNDVKRLKELLKKLPIPVKKNVLLKETRVESKAQRPRTFTCLHLAAFYGFADIVVFLLDNGINVDHLNAKKESALLWAARWGHKECVKILLSRGAQTGLENDKGSTALYGAVRYGHTDTVQLLAREGKANVSQTRKLGLVAPIVLACALGLEEIVVILLDYGANPDMLIRSGERPIHHAAREGFSDIIQLLLKRGATIDAADERGDTALLLAARHGRAKALQTLLEHGANVNTKSLMGQGVWEIAAANEEDLILKLLVIHQKKIALESGNDDTELFSSQGINSLLFLAASSGNVERLSLLFDMKIDAGATDENGNSFLHHAALTNQAEVIKKFHKMVRPDLTNNMGNTPLHQACTRGHYEAIQELINIKAMANVPNKKGETALHLAAYSSSIQPISVSSIMDYVIRTHPYECLNIKDHEGNSCLHIAANQAKPKVLWEFRFVRFKDADVDGNIPLHESVRKGKPECLETMLDIYDAMKRDCDINHQNHKLETPLFLAAREGFVDGVERILLFGADISIADHNGNTVLHELTKLVVEDPIRKATYMELIDLILNHASVWHCNKHNITFHESEREQLKREGILALMEIPNNKSLGVLHYACKLGAEPVVQVLTNMQDVTVFTTDRCKKYDVTHITPRTNETLNNGDGNVTPKASCLEWLLAMKNPQGAARVLDIQPFSDIETAYSSVVAWTYAIIMIFHIAYMSIFSWTGVYLLEKERMKDNNTLKERVEIVMYAIVPMEPILIIGYNAYTIIMTSCQGQLKFKSQQGIVALRGELLQLLVCVVYSLFVIVWIILYIADVSQKDYFLSIALLIGWLISICLTRGFKIIHYFWRMIQNMILKDSIKFMVIYLFVLLAFSFAMHVTIQSSEELANEFPSPSYTMFMVFNLMVGMTELFDGELDTGPDSGRNTLYLKIIYLIYIILATIVLLNLLIAMMNDSYQAIQQKQSLSWRIESVQLGVNVEKSVPATFKLFSKIKVKKGYICPSDKQKDLMRWYIEVPLSVDVSPVMNDVEDEKQVLEEIQANVNSMEMKINEQIHLIKTNMDSIQHMLEKVEEGLKKKKST